MLNRAGLGVSLACLAAVSAAVIWGQAPVGTINGTLKDPTGAVMPGVGVTITNKDNGAQRKEVTGPDGAFNASPLTPGAYTVTAEATGFRTLEENVVVQVGEATTVDLVMQVGAATEVVSVQAEAAQVNYDSHEIAGVITRDKIQELPLNGRDFLQLAMLEPGVSVSASNVGQYNQNFNVNILGASSTSNSVRITVDGATVQDSVTGGTQQNFSQEVVQEFQLASTNFDLSNGIGAGGSINIVTRQGGNDFHGSVFFFYRDHNISAFPTLAHDPGEPSSPYFGRKQEGYWLGGRIIKDKLFFFSSYERTDQEALFSAFPTDPLLFHFGTNADSPSHANEFTERFDWRINNKHTAFLRYSHDGNNSYAPPATGDFPSDWNVNRNWADSGVFSVISVLTPATANEFRYSLTYWSNYLEPPTASQCPAPCLGFGGPNISIIGVSNFALGQATNVPQSRVLRRNIFADNVTSQKGRHSIKFGGYWEYQKGTGTYAYATPAAEVLYPPDGAASSACLTGAYAQCGSVQAFNQALSANGYSAFQVNAPANFNTLQNVLQLPVYGFDIGISPTGDIGQPPLYKQGDADHDNLFHVYFEDTFKITPRFSLNYGLAWSYESNALNHDLTKPPYLEPIFGADGLNFEKHSPHNFSPMLGFAWQPTHDNKTVIRGGAAIYYDTWDIFNRLIERALLSPLGGGRVLLPDSALFSTISSINGFGGLPTAIQPTSLSSEPTTFTGSELSLFCCSAPPGKQSIVFQNVLGLLQGALAVDPTATNIDVFKTAPNNSLIPENFRLDYSEHVSIGVQHQFRDDLVLSSDFVFRQFIHTLLGTDLNHYYATSGPLIPACNASNVTNPLAECSNGPITANLSSGTSHYEGLLMKLDKRFSHRFTGTLSYAYASQVGYNTNINLNDLAASYGPQSGHQTLTGSIVVDLPWNFSISGITSYQSAPVVTPYLAGIDLSGSGAVASGESPGSPLPGIGFNQFNLSAGIGKLQQIVNQFNQSYYGCAPNATGCGIVLPQGAGFQRSFNSQDLRVTKVFKLKSEQRRFSIFGECFNVFNIANLTGYSYALNAPGFGIPTQRDLNVFGSGGPRAFQFGARFQF